VAGTAEAGFAPESFVPHRPPILGVDRILELRAGAAVATRLVPNGPDVDARGALWEEGLIEGLAQTASALHTFGARRGGRKLARGMLVGINQLTIHRRARAGERIEYRVELIRQLEAVSLVRGSARAGDEVLAEGELKFYVEEAP
jgi:3-hydroxyacyl-[acyl-carrier-protein] dehydratase